MKEEKYKKSPNLRRYLTQAFQKRYAKRKKKIEKGKTKKPQKKQAEVKKNR